MRAIDRATAHFRSLGTLSLHVPEWSEEGEEFRVYWTPLTIGERAKLFKDGASVNLATYVDLIVMKALDAQGQPLFTLEDKPRLRNTVSSDVVMRIGLEMLKAPSVEDAEKN